MKKIYWLHAAGYFICVILSVFITTSLLRPREIVTVDLTGLTRNYVQEIAKSSVSPEGQTQAINQFSENLEGSLLSLARNKNYVVLPKQAVISGAEDKTKELVDLMKKRKS